MGRGLGRQVFVADCYRRSEGHFASLYPKPPHAVAGLDRVLVLKRLRAAPA